MRTLEQITEAAIIIYDRVEKDYVEWGQLMLEAKKLVPHGQFGKYLEHHFPEFGKRQAQRYMELARDETKTMSQIAHSKTSRVTHLPDEPNLEREVRAVQRTNSKLLKECSLIPGLVYSLDNMDLSELSGLELQQLRDGCNRLLARIEMKRNEQWPSLRVVK